MKATRGCSFQDCQRRHYGRDLCAAHYQQQAKGKPLRLAREAGLTREQRFWRMVDKSDGPDACWLWIGGKVAGGYGAFEVSRAPRRNMQAHRFAWEALVGPIPEGLSLDHKCFEAACVNPSHLQAVTHRENLENRPGAYRSSKTGVRGVHWSAKLSKYVAQVASDGKKYHVGVYVTLAEADAAARARRIELMANNRLDRNLSVSD